MLRFVRRWLPWTAIPVLLVGLYAALPLLVDANAFKPALVQAVKEATGRELVIDGRIRLRMWPMPRLSVQRVHFANAPGAEGAQMVDVRWVGASPSWWALLRGRLEVGRLILSHPVIVLETDADGVPNWQFRPGAGGMQEAGAPAAGFHLAIGELKIIQGTISYTNPQTRKTLKATEVDITASVGSLQGPLSIKGLATVNGVPLSVDVALGDPSPQGQDLAFLLQVLNGRLEFKGRIDGLREDARFKGRLFATTGELTEFVGNMVQAIGRDSAFDSASIEHFTFDGAVDIAPTRVALDAFTLVAGSESVSGRLALELGGKVPSLQGQVSLPRFDLGRWIALLDQPGLFAWPIAAPPPPVLPPPKQDVAPSAKAPPAKAPAAPAAVPLPAKPPSILTRFDAAVGIEVVEMVWRNDRARDLVAAIDLRDGVLTLPQLRARLPGDATLSASLRPDGEIALSGPRLRDTLAWLGLDTSAIPPGRLLDFSLTGHVIGVPVGLQVPDLALSVDGQTAAGHLGLALGPPPALSVSLQAGHLDLDPYLPPPPVAPSAVPVAAPSVAAAPAPRVATGSPAAAAPPAAPTAPTLDANAPVVSLKTRVKKLRVNQQTLGGVEADAVLQGGLLKVNAVKVADLLGGKIEARGSVAALASHPRFDLTFTANLPDADKVAAYTGLPWFANGHIGAASASGGLSGTAGSLTVRDVSVTLLGATARASGTLGLAPAFHFEFPTFSLKAADIAPLVAVASGKPASGTIGALSVEGAFRGDAARASFDGNLQLPGATLEGTVAATLGQRPTIDARVRLPAPLDLNTLLGLPASPPGPSPASAPLPAPSTAAASSQPPTASAAPPASDRPIDFAALRAVDATLSLEAPSVRLESFSLDDLGLDATLRNGLLTVNRFAAHLFGGTVDLAGTLDATKDSLAVDLKGNLAGVDLGAVLRGTTGKNTFGNEHLMLAVDGKVDIADLSIEGSGRSTGELRAALVARARVGGHLDTSVASGSLGMASFATGLGSIFSTELGFGSAMLSGFVNHQSALAGELGVANNVVSLRKQTIRGNNALASIDSDTSLLDAVTDTTVRLDVGATDTIDYVFTVKGPLAAPEFATRGGTARDSQPKDAPKPPQ